MSDLVVKYGDKEFDFNKLPQASLVAMLRRGVSHFLGSEQASKVTGRFKPDADGKLPEGVVDTPENREAYKAECVAKAIAALIEGTVGVSTRGPALDPIEKVMRGIAKAQVITVLKANNIAVPKKSADAIKFANGDEFTMDQLIERRLAHAEKGPLIRKEAEKEMAKRKKEAEALAAKVQGEALDDL